MAERSAVNRNVVGSSPTWGATGAQTLFQCLGTFFVYRIGFFVKWTVSHLTDKGSSAVKIERNEWWQRDMPRVQGRPRKDAASEEVRQHNELVKLRMQVELLRNFLSEAGRR